MTKGKLCLLCVTPTVAKEHSNIAQNVAYHPATCLPVYPSSVDTILCFFEQVTCTQSASRI